MPGKAKPSIVGAILVVARPLLANNDTKLEAREILTDVA
jgi:hypothetical protein